MLSFFKTVRLTLLFLLPSILQSYDFSFLYPSNSSDEQSVDDSPKIGFHLSISHGDFSIEEEDSEILLRPSTRLRIDTKHLILRTLEPSDSQDYINCFTNPRVIEMYNEGHQQPALLYSQGFESVQTEVSKGDPLTTFGIYLRPTGVFQEPSTFIGLIGFKRFDVKKAEHSQGAELFYLLLPKYWGNKYASEAVTIMIKSFIPLLKKLPPQAFTAPYSLQYLDVIYAHIVGLNIPSKRILEKLGFSVIPDGLTDCHLVEKDYELRLPREEENKNLLPAEEPL